VSTVLELLVLAVGGVIVLALLARGEGRAASVATPLAFGALVLAAWQIACVGFDIPRVLLPAPSAVALAIVRSFPVLAADFMQTVAHAVLIGWLIRGLLPLGNFVSALPIVGIAPIMVMWFGFDWPSKAAVVVVMTFFPMLVNTLAAWPAPDISSAT
jgi:NitT/TauT family transport system permease protein